MEDSAKTDVRIEDIKAVIPPKCFVASTLTSSAYLLRDILYAAALVFLALQIHRLPTPWLRVGAWALYTFAQGCVGTGLWILGHECGHGSFSPSSRINNIVGWAVHSALLVPYFSWKITHSRHHRYTNHPEKDPVFVPHVLSTDSTGSTKATKHWGAELLGAASDTPALSIVRLAAHQVLGWQTYLILNVTAGKKSIPTDQNPTSDSPRYASHYNPFSKLFLPSQKVSIAVSDFGLLLTMAGLYTLAQYRGWQEVALLYVVPYVWVHHWLIAITFLHHCHPDVPRPTAETWTYMKGALGTIDRSVGFIGRHFFHHILDHHVIHHIFPRIPFYHCEEATNAALPLLGGLYREVKDESFHYSLYDTFRECNYMVAGSNTANVEEGDDMLYWRKWAST